MVNETQKTYLFGPVPSRRLGLSLDVDIVPFKVCSLDCVYCQLGRTTDKSIERKDFMPIEVILAQLKKKINEGLEADFITLSGSGEPTLNSRLGEFVEEIKKITNIPVAILTNATLLSKQDVRTDCAKVDLVVPSLSAASDEIFEKINRPHIDVTIKTLIDGLCLFRRQYSGQIWLEIIFVEGINTSAKQIAKIKSAIEHICPDKIHLNTTVRSTAEPGIRKLSPKELRRIAEQIGGNVTW